MNEDRHDVLVVGQAHHQPQRLAEAAAARQLVDPQGVEAAVGGEHQQLVGGLRQHHETLPVALLVLGVGNVLLVTLESPHPALGRSEEHTSELQSLMRISYAVFCLKKKQTNNM